MSIFLVFLIFVLIYSVIIHEYAHGWMADKLGDPTARYAGRLTLNPLPHIDPIGSVLLPLILVLSHSNFLIGWAKPVPFNPYNLRDQKYGVLKVALAGPMANFFIALVLGLFLRFLPTSFVLAHNLSLFVELISYTVWLNLLLMVFNLIPIPPLDGSKIFVNFLPPAWQEKIYRLEGWGMIILFLLIFILFPVIIMPIVSFLFWLITGVAF